jgi:tRNA threonylcarbamoyladenosine biosynthesis protein TsaB
MCTLSLIDDDWRYDDDWQADRQLAKGLLGYLRDQLAMHNKTFDDISGIGVFAGPGSFTGLRIGLTMLNTMADAQNIPIVGVTGDQWQGRAMTRLRRGENDKIVLPLYGADAHITKPRK